MRTVKKAKMHIGIAKSAADVDHRVPFAEGARVVLRQQLPVCAEDAAEEGQADNAAVAVAAQHQRHIQPAPERQLIVAVREHEDEVLRVRGMQLGDQLRRRLGIRRAAGIIHPGDG